MRVLIACEESQRITTEYRKRGHLAFSCDLKDCSGGFPEWHLKCDVIEHLKTVEPFYYDLIIAHPPCTYLSVAGACNFFNKTTGQRNEERYAKQREAVNFFMFFYNYPYCKRICIENPRPIKSAGLPLLFPSVMVLNRRSAAPSWVAANRSPEKRSKTFPGIAKAMAQQWNF